MPAIERHNQILEIIADQQSVTVTELSDELEVSAVTIRNDLRQLSEQGHLIRTHGGAAMPGTDNKRKQELTFTARQQLRAEKKRHIGEMAAGLINPVESILIDSSTTGMAVGRAIMRRADLSDLTIILTGLWPALEFIGSHLNIVLAGGNMRHTTGSLTGPMAREALSKINIHKAFLGAWGITVDQGLTDSNLQEVELKQAVIERCQEVIAVVDGSKFGKVSLSTFAPTEKITRIITDTSAPLSAIQAFRRAGVEVLIADSN